jgi:hypothetical protein
LTRFLRGGAVACSMRGLLLCSAGSMAKIEAARVLV